MSADPVLVAGATELAMPDVPVTVEVGVHTIEAAVLAVRRFQGALYGLPRVTVTTVLGTDRWSRWLPTWCR